MDIKEKIQKMKKELLGLTILAATAAPAMGQSITPQAKDSDKDNQQKEYLDTHHQNISQQPDSVKWKTTKEGVKYAVTPKGIIMDGMISNTPQNLMPKMYEVADNGHGKRVYECGGCIESNVSALKMHVSSIISNTLMMDYIAHDIQANNTGTISLQEADFLQKTEKQMQKLGIKEHNGKYYQVNPAQGFSSSVPVKNMEQLNSQKAKDTKAYAKQLSQKISNNTNNNPYHSATQSYGR